MLCEYHLHPRTRLHKLENGRFMICTTLAQKLKNNIQIGFESPAIPNDCAILLDKNRKEFIRREVPRFLQISLNAIVPCAHTKMT